MFKYNLVKFLPSVIKSIMLLLVSILLSSCFHYVHVTSNAFADEKSIPCGFRYGSKFFVKSARKDDQLFSKEVAYKIETALLNLGYNIVQDVKESDYCLVFNLDMLSSKQTRDVLHKEPDKVSTKKVYSTSVGHPWDKPDSVEEIRVSGEYFYVKENYILFKKELFIEIYDAKLYKETKKQEQLWKSYAYKSGESDDLRASIDYLLISVFKFFGRSTGRNINMSMGEKEIIAERLRLGL